ncbi:hypothetical protein L3i22_015700 [Actinoplanes sp. L3-i22]|nr:hypothetical protein L3i22_015700 [Actinoplanes sp. L3-i22]
MGGRRSSRSSLSSPGIGTGAGLGRFRRLGSVVLGLGSSLGLGVGLRFPVDRKALVGRRVPVFRLGSRGLVFRLGRIRLRDSSSSGSVGFRRSMSSSVRLSRVGPFPSVAGRSRAGLRALPSTAGRSRVGLRALLSTGGRSRVRLSMVGRSSRGHRFGRALGPGLGLGRFRLVGRPMGVRGRLPRRRSRIGRGVVLTRRLIFGRFRRIGTVRRRRGRRLSRLG